MQGFPGGPDSKESSCNSGGLGLISGWEDPLEKGMATHSQYPCLENPIEEEAGGLHSIGSKESDTTKWLTIFTLWSLVINYRHLGGEKKSLAGYKALVKIYLPLSHQVTMQPKLPVLSQFLADLHIYKVVQAQQQATLG